MTSLYTLNRHLRRHLVDIRRAICTREQRCRAHVCWASWQALYVGHFTGFACWDDLFGTAIFWFWEEIDCNCWRVHSSRSSMLRPDRRSLDFNQWALEQFASDIAWSKSLSQFLSVSRSLYTGQVRWHLYTLTRKVIILSGVAKFRSLYPTSNIKNSY